MLRKLKKILLKSYDAWQNQFRKSGYQNLFSRCNLKSFVWYFNVLWNIIKYCSRLLLGEIEITLKVRTQD